MRKAARIMFIVIIGTAVVWMGIQFRPSPDEAAAKVFDKLFAYTKHMPDYLFEQGEGGKPRKVKVNGNQTYLTVQQSDDDITDILNFYAEQYQPIPLDPKLVEAAENMQGDSSFLKEVKAYHVLACLRQAKQFRHQGDNYGFWGTFEFRDKNLTLSSGEYLDVFSRAIESGQLGKIGTFRVTMALKRSESKGARIINLWTDEDFSLNHLHPDASGDMPGDDIENVPRFAGAIRQLSVEQENMNTVDRLVVYEANGAVVNHILYYHSRMPGEGWQADPFFEKTMKEQARDNVMFYRRKGRECTISIDADAGTGKIITTVMDRTTVNS